jgi:hypothetical protein
MLHSEINIRHHSKCLRQRRQMQQQTAQNSGKTLAAELRKQKPRVVQQSLTVVRSDNRKKPEAVNQARLERAF